MNTINSKIMEVAIIKIKMVWLSIKAIVVNSIKLVILNQLEIKTKILILDYHSNILKIKTNRVAHKKHNLTII